MGILFIIGIGIFGGIIGAALFQRLQIPQVIGYIAIGILVGKTGFRIIDQQTIETFSVFNFFALGIIGFLVGGELKGSTLKKYGKQFSGILLGEGLLSFLLVTVLTGGVLFFVTRAIVPSLALGIIFGAIASATDPASTMDVLWEYRAAGVLTTTLIAIVALDDALAMTLYGIGSAVSQILTGGDVTIGSQLMRVGIELFGAIALGAAAGFLLNLILRSSKKRERMLGFSLGLLILVISVAQFFHMDIIFAAMTMGIMVRNLAPERSETLFELIRSISSPIYVLFFVLVGARIEFTNMPWWMWLLVGLFYIGRNGGKFLGAMIGGKITRAAAPVRKYTGFGLASQGGVAIGLALMAGSHMGSTEIMGMEMGSIIIFTVTSTTFLFQVTGPPLVKLAVKLAGELGRDIKPEDVIEKWTVSEAVTAPPEMLRENLPLRYVLGLFSEHNCRLYPVIDKNGKYSGSISFDEIKEVITNQEVWEWLVVKDIVKEGGKTAAADGPLKPVLDEMKQTRREYLAVVNGAMEPVGVLDISEVDRAVEREIITIKGAAA